MKSIVIVLALLVATSDAFSPLLATRAEAKLVTKKAVAAKTAAPLNLNIKAPPKAKINIQGP